MREQLREMIENTGIEDWEMATIRKHRSRLTAMVPNVIEQFYDHLYAVGHGSYFKDIDVARLKAAQLKHWSNLFDADFAGVYTNHVTKIGITHRERHVSPKVYMQAYGWFTSRLMSRIAGAEDLPAQERASLTSGILKLIFLDMALAVSSYDAALID